MKPNSKYLDKGDKILCGPKKCYLIQILNDDELPHLVGLAFAMRGKHTCEKLKEERKEGETKFPSQLRVYHAAIHTKRTLCC